MKKGRGKYTHTTRGKSAPNEMKPDFHKPSSSTLPGFKRKKIRPQGKRGRR